VFGEDGEARATAFIFFALGVTLIYGVLRFWLQRSYKERSGGRKYRDVSAVMDITFNWL
jgi:hypothetical protein